MYNFLISDFIARLNVAKSKHVKTIIIKPSKLVLDLLKMFEELGLIRGYMVLDNSDIEVFMRYNRSQSTFKKLIVVSKPSKRVYMNLLNLVKYKGRYFGHILILSTDHGFMLDVDCLKKKKGGEIILRIVF